MPDFSPPETQSQLFDEKMWLQGALITSMGYGSVLTLFVLAIYLLSTRINRFNFRRHVALLSYVSIQFILATLFQASSCKYTQLAFIENRNYPGGPGQYEIDFFSIPIDEMGNAAYTISNWLSDALLLWRCAVIYGGCTFPLWLTMFFPCLIMLGSMSCGIMYLIQSSGHSPFASGAANFTIIYPSVSLGLNLMMTIMIISRLLLYRYRILKAIPDARSVSHYTGVIAMLVESATLYAAFTIFFIVPFACGSSVENIPFQSLSMVQVISPFLIIVRVSQGKAWSQETGQQLMSSEMEGIPTAAHVDVGPMKFAPSQSTVTTGLNSFSRSEMTA